jgi:hypothetical protein
MPSAGWQPPRRRRSPFVLALAIGATVVVAVLVGVVVMANARDHRSSAPPAHIGAPTHSLPTYSPPPADAPTAAATTSSDGDYGSPERNAIYRSATMRDVHCDITLSTVTIAAYHSYLKSAMSCLNRAWKTVLTSRGIAFSPPALDAVDEQPADPCGNQQAGYQPASFYCSDNGGVIYVNVPRMVQIYGAAHSDYLEEIPAHEYGHHLQTLDRLWDYYSPRFDDAYPDDVAAYTLLSRRMELQAECFAGVFMSHNLMKSSTTGLTNDAAELGDDQVPGWETNPSYRNHGLGRDTVAWFQRGLSTGRASSCNTWTASSASVA